MKWALLSIVVVGVGASRSSWVNLGNEVKNGLFPRTQPTQEPQGPLDPGTPETLAVGEDPELSDDYNKEHHIRIEGGERLPITIESIVATIWCCMIASIPFIIIKFQESELTKLVIIESILLLLWLVGGITAFTQVILFQSAHWEGIRSLTIVESTYLLTQILTTIGYGDITPAMPRGQVVCAIYILLSVILVGNMFSQVVQLIEARLADAVEKGRGEFAIDEESSVVQARLSQSEEDRMESARTEKEPTSFEWVDMPKVEFQPVINGFCGYVVIATIGICFFHLYPGEDKTWMEAIYMSIVTLSTVGFGAFTATTEVGKAFSSFWMLFGVAALGNFVSCCVEWSLKKKALDAYSPAQEHISWTTLLQSMDRDGDANVNSDEFLRFALVHAGYVTEEQIEKLAHFFRKMHPDKNGLVPLRKFQDLGAPTQVRSPRKPPTPRKP